MGRLLTVGLYLTLLYTVECKNKRGTVDSNYGNHPYHQNSPKYTQQIPFIYNRDSSNSAVAYDSTKTSPVVVSVPPVSSYQLNQQYHTVPQHALEGFTLQAGTAQVPYTAPQQGYFQGVVPYGQTNQYSVNHPFSRQNLYIPFNQFQHLSSNVNSDYQKHLPLPSNSNQQVHQPKVGPVVGAVKPTPLFHHQVIHPQHTAVQGPRKVLQKQRVAPPPPPSPPKIYRNFQPIVQRPIIPVNNPPASIKNSQREREQEEDKEEVNEEEEEEEENEKLEDDDNAGFYREEGIDDDEDHFRPEKFLKGRFDNEDHERYRNHEADDDEEQEDYKSDSHKYSETRPETSKLFSHYKYPKDHDKVRDFKAKQTKPFETDPYFKNFREFRQPKMEFKMYKYSKSSNNPERKEHIEGKGSENVPVIQHKQNSYKEQWIISTRSLDE